MGFFTLGWSERSRVCKRLSKPFSDLSFDGRCVTFNNTSQALDDRRKSIEDRVLGEGLRCEEG